MKKPARLKSIPRRAPQPAATPPGDEADILAELQKVCTQPGYVHTLAYLCFRDNMLLYSDELTEGRRVGFMPTATTPK